MRIVKEHKKLGFGFMRLPVKNIHDQTNIDIEELYKMADRFIGSGFSYFDLACIYHNGVCEKPFNQAVVSRYSRDKYLVATKMPLSIAANKEHHEQIFSEQLRNCGVDYFDYYLLHGVDYNTIPAAEKLNSFDFINEKKKAGLIRHIGFSYHDTPESLDEILTKHPEVDFVQLQMNYLDWESPSIQSRRCCEVTKKYNKQIIVMEPVKGGILANVPEQIAKLFKGYNPDLSTASWAIRFAASQEKVVMILSGMSNTAQIDDNVRYMQNFVPLSETEYSIIQQAISLFKRYNRHTLYLMPLLRIRVSEKDSDTGIFFDL
jgi:predicted aldo/keto reductase-like oxidoreductase